MDDSYTPKKRNNFKWLPVLLGALAGVVVVILFLIHGSNNSKTTNPTMPTSPVKSTVESLVSYQLPDGWTKVECGGENDVVLIVPAQRVKPDCATLSDSWPMTLMKDPMKTTDCNQIKVNNQQITNHVCSSQNVNGQKMLVSSTTYNDKSLYGKDTKVSDYYLDTKKGVIKLEYADDQTSTEDDYQAQFDQIANSMQVK